ncbi:hypothetical protein Bhyg_12175 [Pseudolycoriella hygida]|uniref:Uncharacterized protein n=1 Tax=Pseudolycoriella hygida TaxID=35572 RepID=A0A9Q0MX20_9DIPT|nr:hypothetical protein Bhyg_12175 [Pseudolycoriella hygida]
MFHPPTPTAIKRNLELISKWKAVKKGVSECQELNLNQPLAKRILFPFIPLVHLFGVFHVFNQKFATMCECIEKTNKEWKPRWKRMSTAYIIAQMEFEIFFSFYIDPFTGRN